MPNLESNVLSVCPFFVRERGTRIVCEGIVPDTLIETDFKNSRSKKLHQKCCCYSFEYRARCSLCRAIYQKYDAAL